MANNNDRSGNGAGPRQGGRGKPFGSAGRDFKPQGGRGPARDFKPQGERGPARDFKPQGGYGPVRDFKPQGERGSARDFKPQGSFGPARDFKPQGERGPARDFKPQGERGPARDFKPQGERGPARDFKPQFERGPARDFKPQFERGPARDFKPQGERGPARDFKPQGGRNFDSPRPTFRPGTPGPRRATPPYGQVPPATRVDAPAQQVDAPTPRESYAPRESFEQTYEMPENLLVGRNPIREALKSGQGFEKMLVAKGDLTGSAREIVAMARDRHVVIQYVERVRLDQIYKNHQGMLAYVSAAEYSSIEEILELAVQRDEDAFVVVLDGITDPHNMGAIIRSAECMGAHGVIIPDRRSAGLNPAAVKAAAGALSHIKVARVVNITRTLGELKEKGLWITGGVMDGTPIDQVNLTGPLALVVGSEGEGISQLVKQQCDHLVKLPMYGQIESLNASVAAGILLYEIARARHGA